MQTSLSPDPVAAETSGVVEIATLFLDRIRALRRRTPAARVSPELQDMEATLEAVVQGDPVAIASFDAGLRRLHAAVSRPSRRRVVQTARPSHRNILGPALAHALRVQESLKRRS